jgi:hypothetical protein
MTGVSANRYGCNINKDRGPAACANSKTVRRDLVDRRLVADIRDLLAAPESVADLQAAVRSAVAVRRKEAAAASESIRKRVAQLDAELARLIDAVATIGASQALAERIRAAEVERADLLLQVAAPADASQLLADVTSRYRRMLLDLETVLADEERDRTRAILADIVGPVTIVHEGAAVYAELEEPAERLLVAAGGRTLGMVAGARIGSRRRLRIA